MDPEMLKSMQSLLWAQETEDARMNGRTPDPLKVTNMLGEFVGSMQAMFAAGGGGTITRRPDGGYSFKTDPVVDPTAPPETANTPPAPFTMPAPGVDFSTALPQVPVENPKPIRPRGNNTPSPVMDEIRALQAKTEDQLRQFLKDPRLTKAQLISVREELRSRDVRKRALNSSSPGLR
jgi:hypothetical protein